MGEVGEGEAGSSEKTGRGVNSAVETTVSTVDVKIIVIGTMYVR